MSRIYIRHYYTYYKRLILGCCWTFCSHYICETVQHESLVLCSFIVLFLLHKNQQGLTGVIIHAEWTAHGWSSSNTHTTFGQMQALFWGERCMMCTMLKSFAMFLSLIIYRKSGCTKALGKYPYWISTWIINNYLEVLELSLQYMHFKGLVPSLLYLAISQIVFYYWFFCCVFLQGSLDVLDVSFTQFHFLLLSPLGHHYPLNKHRKLCSLSPLWI